VRARSVTSQLEGKSGTATETESNLTTGRDREPPEGHDSEGGFRPAAMLAAAFMGALDTNHDRVISHAEFTNGFSRWFDEWNSDKTGTLTAQQLRSGINQDLAPFHGHPAERADFQPPEGPPPFNL